MSGLLLLLASGWTVKYQSLDMDEDVMDIMLPSGALCLMIHVVMGCLTFVDLEASHKYHDFAGV